MAGRAGVPQSEAGDAVRVDVLGRALELGEDREFVPRALGVRMGYFEQHRPVALHDERAVSHRDRVYRTRHPIELPRPGSGRTDADDARHRQGALDIGGAVAPAQPAAAEARRLEGERAL